MRWLNSLIMYLYMKQSSKVQKLIQQKTENNMKKIELVNGEVKSLTGYGKSYIGNKVQSFTFKQQILEVLSFLWRFEILMTMVYIIISWVLQDDATSNLVVLFQSIVLLLDYSLYVTKCLLKFRNFRIVESQLNEQRYSILENFIHSNEPLASDSSEDINTYFYPQKQVLEINYLSQFFIIIELFQQYQENRLKLVILLQFTLFSLLYNFKIIVFIEIEIYLILNINYLLTLCLCCILQKTHECPADVLLLESSHQMVQIDQNEFGISTPKITIPCQSTFIQPKSDTKGLLVEFKLTLNGQIQYSYSLGKKSSLMGMIKLKNDPKVFKFNQDNIIFSGEKLLNTDWALGIVLVAGNNCLRIYKPSKHKRQKSLFFIGMIILGYIISLLANLIYKSNYGIQLCFNSMLLSLYAIFYKEFIQIYNYIKQPSIQKKVKPINAIEQGNNQGKDIVQDDKHIWIEFNRVKNMTEIYSQNKLSKYEDIKDFTIMMQQTNYWKCSKVNLVCLELNQQYFQKKRKIQAIYIDDKQYTFKYKQLVTVMNNNQVQLGDNYYKTLLDTGRENDIFDEDKKDYSELINSNPFSPHNNNQEERQNYGISTNLQFSLSKKTIDASQQKKLKNSLGKTISFRTKIVKSGGDQSSSINYLQKQQLNEQQFITQLFDDFDNQYHERVVALLLLCEIENKYNEQKKTIETYCKNPQDYILIEFCNLLEYKLKCSIETERQIYDLFLKSQLKIIEIQGKLKQYKILSENKQTKNRIGVYSVLLKDPEEFNEDEGALLYIKIETSQMYENTNMNINVLETNSTLYYMLKQGQQPTLYFKKQLKKVEAKQFLLNKMNIMNSYTTDEDQLELLYLQLESQAELLMIIGSHAKIEQSTLLTIDAFSQANLNTWLVSAESQFVVLRFLFDAKFIENENDLYQFNTGDERTLKFAIQSACSNLIKSQRIFEAQDFDKKYILLSCEALLTIIKDEFLLNHFAIIVWFSRGLALYDSQEISKVKLFKIAKKLNMQIGYIGSCANTQRVYNMSQISIDINPKCYTQSKPCYLVNSLRCAESILINHCINSSLLAQQILYFWLYQMILFVLINLINQAQFLTQSCNILLLLSQTFTVVIQLISHNNRFKTSEVYYKGLIPQRCLVKALFNKDSLLKIFFVGVIDATIVSIPLYATKYLYGDSNYLPISQFAFIITLELIVKIQLYFQIFEQQYKQLLGLLLLSVFIIALVTFLTIPDYNDYKVSYSDLFYSPGYIIRSLIFVYIFAFVFKFAITSILQLYIRYFQFIIQ